jgi:radical SAM superfamily enzyme YgiQ (UPF0313 family)
MPLDQINERGFPVISSRGCVFGCSYCGSSLFWERKWYPRSPENIIEEILSTIDKTGFKRFMFEDDNFTLNSGRAIKVCELIQSKILTKYPDVAWECASRASSLKNKELCKAMSGAKCYRVWLGVESGSKKILELCNKATIPDEQMDGIVAANAAGISTIAQFISGLSGETDDTINETVNFIKRAKPSYITCQNAWILPGTELYKQAYNLKDSIYLSEVPFFTYENSIEKLTEWNAKIMGALN